MKAIIIAAGVGKRMGDLTKTSPKCLVKVNGTTLLENIITRLRAEDINDISVVVGYQANEIVNKIKRVKYFVNEEYKYNNILHSLMYARSFMDDDLIISYADIWLEQAPLHKLIDTKGNCVISVDSDWEKNYIGRTDHPISEAENVIYNSEGYAIMLGKHINPLQHVVNQFCGEFIGLCKLSKEFCSNFITVFEELNQSLQENSPFQNSKMWSNAYLTDFFNELIARQHEVKCSLHEGGWQEIDTLQDYQRACARWMESVDHEI